MKETLVTFRLVSLTLPNVKSRSKIPISRANILMIDRCNHSIYKEY